MNTTAEHIMISIQAVTIVGCEDSILVRHRSVFKQNGDTACILKMKGTSVAQDICRAPAGALQISSVRHLVSSTESSLQAVPQQSLSTATHFHNLKHSVSHLLDPGQALGFMTTVSVFANNEMQIISVSTLCRNQHLVAHVMYHLTNLHHTELLKWILKKKSRDSNTGPC